MATNARQAEVDARSLWVTIAARAVSLQISVPPLLRWGITIGAIRMRAPLPADSGPLSYQGLPAARFAWNALTVEPMPKILPLLAERLARFSGISPRSSMS